MRLTRQDETMSLMINIEIDKTNVEVNKIKTLRLMRGDEKEKKKKNNNNNNN